MKTWKKSSLAWLRQNSYWLSTENNGFVWNRSYSWSHCINNFLYHQQAIWYTWMDNGCIPLSVILACSVLLVQKVQIWRGGNFPIFWKTPHESPYFFDCICTLLCTIYTYIHIYIHIYIHTHNYTHLSFFQWLNMVKANFGSLPLPCSLCPLQVMSPASDHRRAERCQLAREELACGICDMSWCWTCGRSFSMHRYQLLYLHGFNMMLHAYH